MNSIAAPVARKLLIVAATMLVAGVSENDREAKGLTEWRR